MTDNNSTNNNINVIGSRIGYAARLGLLLLMMIARGAGAVAQTPATGSAPVVGPTGVQWEEVGREANDLLLRYLRIDTTNPPGNEIAAAGFFAAICQREGIEHRVFEPAPGRGIIWARLRGDGSQRPLILLNHLDVVPHSPEHWSTGAFAGTIKGDFIYGRGAMDMKSLGIAQFMAMLLLNRARVPLRRDLIFLGTADEEAGGLMGAGWFVRNHPELLGKAEFLLNEGGSNYVEDDGRVRAVGISPAEKTPAWLRLTARGEPGHASIPRAESSVNRLLRALSRLVDYSSPLKLTPAVEQAFRSFSPLMEGREAARFANLRAAITDPDFVMSLEADPPMKALFHNTISITMLSGSSKINVIPPLATAEIDTRLVPGENLARWIEEIRGVIRDPNISIEPILAFEGNESPTETALVRSIRATLVRRHPGALITHPVVAGFTDSHYFREAGIASYGFSPFLAPPGRLGQGYHGNDERIGREAFTAGIRFLYEAVEDLAR